MLTDCPDPSEVTDFHFLQLRTLRTAAKDKSVPEISGNILASASKYGLLFVGVEGGFKVIRLESVLNFDEDKENRSIIEDFPHDFVPSGTPAILSVNAAQTTLAVCVKCATNVVINLYSLSSYGGGGWQPFCANALSPSGADVRDFVWNPAMEGWYAICFSDGSLQIHEVAGLTVKAVSTVHGAGAVAVCWSPKGKQLVAGKENGSFTQYKPNLTEVKTVLPPALQDGPLSVSSICWIANTLFAVVYVAGDSPNLFMVSTPKDSPVVYTNFYDVCLGNNSAPQQKYLLHLEPSWGILVCASLDSIEIAVLGNMPNFVQWDLKEDGKALLPGKDGATHAVGLAVVYSAQKQLVISESECYPPMPVLFLLTNNGLLVSFHMVNSNPSAASLVSAPLPLEGKVTPATQASLLLSKQVPSTSNQGFASATFIKGNEGFGDQAPAEVIVPQPFIARTESLTSSYIPPQKELPNLRGDVKKSEGPSLSQVQMTPASGHLGVSPSIHTTEKQQSDVPSSDSQSSYMTAIIAEIQSFVKELQELRQLQMCAPVIDGEEDMVPLKSYVLNLHNFQKDISDTMQSISSDIYSLKNMLLESFVLVEEAASRERRRNDHSYVTMLKERALDPMTARRMRRMSQHHQYLATQLREVSDKLDQQWMQMRRATKGGVCISSTEAIYKTIVNNQKIIHNLRKRVELLTKKADERRLWNTTKGSRYQKRSVQEDLSKLADAFLQVRIAQHPEEGEMPAATVKKLSPASQRVLRDFLKRSSVVTVRPTAIYSPSQSRLLSNTTPSEDFLGLEHTHGKDVSPKPVNTPSGEKGATDSSEVQTPKIATKLSFSFEGSPNQSVPTGPVYEAITPPEATPTPAIKNASGDKVNIPGSPVVTEQPVYQQPLFKPTSSGESSIKSGIDQGSSFNMMSSININATNLQNTSFSGKGKPLTFNQTSSESMPPASTSLFFTKPISSVPSCPKPNEVAALNLVASSSSVTSPTTIFQYAGIKKDPLSAVPNQTSSATSTKASSQLVISESPQFSQPATSLTQLTMNTVNQSVSANTTQSLPSAKTLQVSSSSLFAQPENKTSNLFTLSENKTSTLFAQPENKTSTLFAQPENKTSTLFAQPENKNATLFAQPENKTSTLFAQPENKNATLFAQPESKSSTLFAQPESKSSTLFAQPENKNTTLFAMSGDKNTSIEKGSVGFFFQTPSSGVNQSPLKTDAVPVSSSSTPANEISIPSKANTVDSKSSPDSQLKAIEKPIPAHSTSASTPVAKSDVPVTTVSQPTVGDTFSSVSELKQLISSPQTSPASEPPVVTTTVAVSDLVPQPVSSADVAKPTPVTSVISQPVSTTPTAPVTVSAPPATTASLLFGQSTVVTTAVSSGTESSATDSAPVFGAKAAQPLFKTTSADTPSFFGAAANTFGQQPVVTQSSPFGQSTTFPSAATGGGFFSQVPNFESPATTTTTSSSDFNSQASTFSFAKPAFGQTTGSSFGLAKSFFGQNATTPFTQAGSTASSFSFAQGTGSVFGQGSFFSGLGGKPSEENANKNVFGLSSNIKIGSETTNIFKNSSVTSLGAVNSGSNFTGSGTFSSGTGSVAQAGFGAFQQNTQPQAGGFGSSPSFGGAPAFGSPPAFGGSPSFGSGSAFSSSVFGQQQQVSSNFSNFANASSPTFGSLASQSPGSFGSSSPVSGFGGAGFGSAPVFGGSSFGANQSTGFGSPGSPPSNSSAFTQWRN